MLVNCTDSHGRGFTRGREKDTKGCEKMKTKVKHITKKLADTKGVLIVEAAIVFPVMFFILLFIIFIGNLFYEQARVDDIVMRYAIMGAQCAADPFLDDMYKSNGTSVPHDPKSVTLEPYRYVMNFSESSSISEIETMLSKKVQEEINTGSLVFFDGVGTKYLSSENKKICEFQNHILYSTFVVQVNYEVQIPISYMDMSQPTIMRLKSRAEVPVSDTDEFIRNVDMAMDLLEETKAGQTIAGIFEKVTGFISNFAAK